MQIRLMTTLALFAMTSLATLANAAPDLKDPKQKLSYAIGTGIGANFKKQGVDVDPDVLLAGIKDALAGKQLAMTEAEITTTLNAARADLAAKQQAKQQADASVNASAGDAYLAANAKKEGVKTTASGLQYKVIKPGTGKTPGPKDTVKVHYQGTLIDGTVFDSSIQRGEPATFPVNGVIAGWTEALLMMKEGAKYQLVIPPKLAYGVAGQGPIGPNAVLIFDVELIDIEK